MKAIVTGATRGIGHAVAVKLAKQGFDLAICSRNQKDLEKLAKKLKKDFGTKTLAIPADFSDEKSIEIFVKSVKSSWKEVDIIVNNVGSYEMGSLLDESKSLLGEMMMLNCYSAINVTRPFLKSMKKRKSGHIFNICSVAFNQPRKEAASYTIAKYALTGYSRVLCDEMKDHGVKVTSIIPGSVNTSSWDGINAPKKDFVQPEDVADTIWTCFNLSKGALVEEVLVKPINRNY